MSSERLWVLVLAVNVFCAGIAAGVLLTLRWHPGEERRPFQQYEARLVETFDLDQEHTRNLRYILQSYADEIEALEERSLAELDPELIKQGLRHRDLIRTWVVPEHRRQEFDLWVGGFQVRESRLE